MYLKYRKVIDVTNHNIEKQEKKQQWWPLTFSVSIQPLV